MRFARHSGSEAVFFSLLDSGAQSALPLAPRLFSDNRESVLLPFMLTAPQYLGAYLTGERRTLTARTPLGKVPTAGSETPARSSTVLKRASPMRIPSELYRPSLALLTDLYQLTMAYGYWKSGVKDKEAVFNLFFRENPFHAGFTIACGLGYVVDLLSTLRFDAEDTAYLAKLCGADGEALFDQEFLHSLQSMQLSCHVDAIPEGTVVFPHEPLVRVQGPIIQCQILETVLLNLINFQTLIATKAAHICLAARGEPVLEFGLRRAHGIDGALAASRAAYIGGCAATSNVLAGKLFGIPVRGTHAHSWVMAFDDELESFQAYAEAMPNNCIFLVDTYNTLEGVRKAIRIGKWLREHGHEMIGIRLDSGDLAQLSIEARRILDEAGFPQAVIVGSNDLDEHLIESLKKQGAPIGVWGVGTKLVTAYDQPALGGVYKLTAVREPGGPWRDKIKLSEEALKVSNPGILQVRRYHTDGKFLGDVIYNEETGLTGGCTMVDLLDPSKRQSISDGTPFTDLLVPVFREGKVVYEGPPLEQMQKRTQDQLAHLPPDLKHSNNPQSYPVGLELSLHELKTRLILQVQSSTI
jgi:nicotinate phosphoribosyltransferase